MLVENEIITLKITKMKKILIALFIGFSAFINAQNKISGKITDKDNNPIKGVNIFVSELHKSSETDENGAYSINNVPNGTIKITYTLLGFTSQNKTTRPIIIWQKKIRIEKFSMAQKFALNTVGFWARKISKRR